MKVNWATSPGTATKQDTSKHFHVFIGDLSPDIESAQLREAFAPFGQISDCKVIRDPQTHKSKGFGFVCFVHKEEAEMAIAGMNGQWLGGRTIRTNWATGKGGITGTAKTVKSDYKELNYDEVFNQTSATNTTVYLGGIASELTEDLMRDTFSEYGKVIDVRIFKEKGYAFIKMESKEAACSSICGIHQTEINGYTVKCSWGKEGGEYGGGGGLTGAPPTGPYPPYGYGYPGYYGYWGYPPGPPPPPYGYPPQYMQPPYGGYGNYGYGPQQPGMPGQMQGGIPGGQQGGMPGVMQGGMPGGQQGSMQGGMQGGMQEGMQDGTSGNGSSSDGMQGEGGQYGHDQYNYQQQQSYPQQNMQQQPYNQQQQSYNQQQQPPYNQQQQPPYNQQQQPPYIQQQHHYNQQNMNQHHQSYNQQNMNQQQSYQNQWTNGQ